MNKLQKKIDPLGYVSPAFLFFSLGLIFASPTVAQSDNPNQNRFLQPSHSPQPLPLENSSPNPETSPIIETSQNTAYFVEKIEVTGSSIFSEEELQAIVEPLVGESITRQEILEAVREITKLYLDGGYLTSRAVLLEESLDTNQIQIQVLEGRLGDIEIEGIENLNSSYIRSRIELANRPILNTTKLENQLRLLRINPLIETVEASLRAGENVQESILVLRIKEANPWIKNVSLDNYSPPSVGSEEATNTLGHRNVTGNGDTLQVSYSRTIQGGAEDIDINYTLPINAKNGTIQLRTSFGSNEVIEDEFEELDIEGDFDLVEISYRQPFVRTPRTEFALSLGFTYQKGETFLLGDPTTFGLGPDDGVSQTSVIKFGQDYVKRSGSGAWAARSQFSFGTNFFDATENGGDIPDGQFISWLGQLQRIQILSPNNVLIIQADLQLSSDELLPSQQFVIGGGQSVRGYRHNILAADQGLRLAIENQITLSSNEAGEPLFKLAPFVEAGAVINKESNPNSINQEQTAIAGLGMGLLWNPISNLNIRLDYGIPLVDLDNTGDNIQDDGLYFSLSYSP